MPDDTAAPPDQAPAPPRGTAALPSVAVFDIDGVLADVRHRLHHVAARPKDWDAFFGAAPQDPHCARDSGPWRPRIAPGTSSST